MPVDLIIITDKFKELKAAGEGYGEYFKEWMPTHWFRGPLHVAGWICETLNKRWEEAGKPEDMLPGFWTIEVFKQSDVSFLLDEAIEEIRRIYKKQYRRLYIDKTSDPLTNREEMCQKSLPSLVVFLMTAKDLGLEVDATS